MAWVRSKPEDEIAAQYEVLRRFTLRRRALVTVAFSLGLAYQDLRVALAFWLLDTLFDSATLLCLRKLNPARSPGRYLLALGLNMGLAATFTGFPALSWLVEAPLAKAYALSLLLIALVHHATLRNIHLPLSVGASFAATVVALIANTLLWGQRGDYAELALTTLALTATTYYAGQIIRTMHRLQADLRRERKAARDANLAKTRFVAQLSHELRTPLNALIGLSEAERLMSPHPEAKARLDLIVTSAHELGALLEDTLDLSTIEAEGLTIRHSALNPVEQIELVARLYRPQFTESAMTLTLDFAPDLPPLIWADGRKLRQCLSNILSNALKYGRGGPVWICARAEAGDLVLRITDSGPGVPPALGERIFEPFFRGQEDGRGTGLGLAISRRLARAMGGDLTLDHAPRGARFRLSLPLALPPEIRSESLPRLEGRHVLVVDDLATNRMVASAYLRGLGLVPVEAASGPEAIERMRSLRPDVILLDLQMPGLDGARALARLRAEHGPALPPVLAVSAEPANPAEGFDGAILKPLSLDKLREALVAAFMAQG
jgi:signal transduction histidine kinase/CheY-like chemotaxis protein